MNRLKTLLGEPDEPDRPDDFYEIESRFEVYAVSRHTAEDVARRLDEHPPPRWIAFRDLTGAGHRILASKIARISESTTAQRAARREFRRARRLEDKSDRRPWEDDDYG